MTPYTAFRSHDFRLILTGTLLTSFGLQMTSVAVSWDLYLRTRSALVLGNVGFVQVAPFLAFALIAGHLADRYDRRRVMLFTQTLVLAASVLLLVAPRSVFFIYTSLFLIASGRALGGPARAAVLPDLVPTAAIQTAITWNSSAFEFANVSGPALAGILIATAGSGPVYVIQTICAALVLVSFWRLRVPQRTRAATPGAHGLLDGLRFVGRDKLVLPTMSLDLLAVLFGGATALLPIFAVDILHGGAHTLGWLRAAPSLGALSMAFVLAHSGRMQHAGKVLLLSVAGFGLATLVFAASRVLWLSFLMLVLTGAFDNISVVLRQALVQTRPPEHVRGRVLAVNSIFISCSNQLGAVESGWTAAFMGPVGSVLFGGVATLLVVAGFAYSKPLREWKQ